MSIELKYDKEDEKNVLEDDWGVVIDLYEHQKRSILGMEQLEKTRLIETKSVKCLTSVGILGDIVGSGKTLSMISLLSRDKIRSFESINKLYTNNNIHIDYSTRKVVKYFNSIDLNNEYCVKVKKYMQNFYYINTNIILVSPLTLKHWQKELSKSNLNCLYIYKENDICEYDENMDVIVVTYNKYNSLVNYLNVLYKDLIQSVNGSEIFVKRLIIDEINFIPNMVRLEAGFFWIITTRSNICNVYTESQIMRCFIKKLLVSIHIPSVIIRNTRQEIINSYNLPSIIETSYICHSLFSDFSSEFLSEEIKKMIAADDLQSAIEYLGGHLSDNNNLQITILQKERDVLKRYEAKVKYYSNLGDEKKLDHYSKKLENKITSINKLEERIKNLGNECPICMESIENVKIIVGCCTNVFCENCILEILKSSCKCALCRKVLDPSNMIYNSIIDEPKVVKSNNKITKTKQTIDIIKSNMNGKFVIFSEYNNTLDKLVDELTKSKILVSELKGTVDRINNIISQFSKGKINVLLLNSRNDGAGINLQECTDLIIYHRMEKNLEEQIIGRAHRLGRTETLNVHRLLHTNE
jgi:SNF2 family DNA or RNA helicase